MDVCDNPPLSVFFFNLVSGLNALLLKTRKHNKTLVQFSDLLPNDTVHTITAGGRTITIIFIKAVDSMQVLA